MKKHTILLLLLLLVYVFGACPNNCSGHGSCISNFCTCETGWHGRDCSIDEVPLNDGQTVSGTVTTFGWKYYYIENSERDETLEISLNQTSNDGDCDIYVRPNSIPTRSSYYARDISTNTTMFFQVPHIAQGVWFIAVYGFTGCSYNMRAHVTGGCPNDCSGHGTCLNKRCQCEPGWSSDDCSAGVTTLSLGQSVSGSVQDDEWTDFKVDITSGNAMVWTMTRTSSTGDCDLFLRYGSPATLFSWDYLNATTEPISKLIVTDPAHGTWYAGVYGFQGCSFNIVAESTLACPNKCSEHGSCNSGSVCQCSAGYSGEACEMKNQALSDGQAVSGYVGANFWNYYTYASDSADNLVITVNQEESGNQDCDLYVKAGSRPTRFNYDFQDTSVTSSFTLTIPDPGDASWNIGVYGWSDCRYQLTAADSSSCPQNCNNRGQCNSQGHCVCNAGYGGEACEDAITALQNNVLIGANGQTTSSINQWTYYSITPTPGSGSLHIQIKELNTPGYLWLFLGKEYPTLRNYEESDESLNSNIHRINIELDPTQTQAITYYIGVYGSPFFPSTAAASYEIIAWYSDFQ